MPHALLTILILLFFCTTAVAADAHLLRAGDVLEITVYNHPELDLSARVQQDGHVRIPLCGKVKASGVSVGTLAEALSKLFEKKKIERAFVTIFVTTFAPRPVYVLGEVKQGGVALEIPPQGRLTALQAIGSAGGFSEIADKANVGILRLQPDGTQKRLAFNAASVIGGAKGTSDLKLSPGDTILVPRALPVSVFGMVGQPGAFAIDTETLPRCSELLSRAGGPTKEADLKQVLIIRTIGDKPQSESVDMDAVLAGDLTKDSVIRPGDVIIVNGKDRVYVLGEVKAPGSIVLERKIPLTMTKAIAQVGGVTRNANRRAVLLLRGDKAFSINLKAILDEDRKVTDRVLHPGDVIYVQESIW